MNLDPIITMAVAAAVAILLGVLGILASRHGTATMETPTNANTESAAPLGEFLRTASFLKGALGVALIVGMVIAQLAEGRPFHQGMLMAIFGCGVGLFLSIRRRTAASLYAAFFLGALLVFLSPQDMLAALGMPLPTKP